MCHTSAWKHNVNAILFDLRHLRNGPRISVEWLFARQWGLCSLYPIVDFNHIYKPLLSKVNSKTYISWSEDAESQANSDAVTTTVRGKYNVAAMVVARVVASDVSVWDEMGWEEMPSRTSLIKRSYPKIQPVALSEDFSLATVALVRGVSIRRKRQKGKRKQACDYNKQFIHRYTPN